MVAVPLFQSLVWKLPYAAGSALKTKKKKVLGRFGISEIQDIKKVKMHLGRQELISLGETEYAIYMKSRMRLQGRLGARL